MLKIRLSRRGKKNNAFFRVVVAEHTSPVKGGFLEVLGFLNPHTKEKNFKADRIEYWIGKGAQCSDTVHNLLVSNGVIKGSKRAMKLKKKPVEPASAEVPVPPADKPAGESEKKSAEATEAKPEEKVEPKKESIEKEAEAAKSEPEQKEEKKDSKEEKK